MIPFIFSCAVHKSKPFVAQREQMISCEPEEISKEKKSRNLWISKCLLLTQVETVGDKYMTVSGLPEPCTHHAKSICHLALDMLEIAGQVKVDDEPVQVGYVVLTRSLFIIFSMFVFDFHAHHQVLGFFCPFQKRTFLCRYTGCRHH